MLHLYIFFHYMKVSIPYESYCLKQITSFQTLWIREKLEIKVLKSEHKKQQLFLYDTQFIPLSSLFQM